MNIILLFAALLCFTLSAQEADAAEKCGQPVEQPYGPPAPMRIIVVRSVSTGCEPSCPMWISVEGAMLLGSAEELRKVVNSVFPRKLPVLIQSNGGSVREAVNIGRLIRMRGLDVAVAKTVFDPCLDAPGGCKQGTWRGALGQPDSRGAFCYSACPLALAGGIRRFVAPNARVAVHQTRVYEALVERWRSTYRSTTPMESVIQNAMLPTEMRWIGSYLEGMGISKDLLALMDSTPPTCLRTLSESELASVRLATDFQSGQTLVDQSGK